MTTNQNTQLFEINKNKRFYSVTELAAYLGISKSSIHRFRARDEIPYVKLGGRVVFPINQIEEWLKKKGA